MHFLTGILCLFNELNTFMLCNRQTNAVNKLSLEFTIKTAKVLNITDSKDINLTLYQEIYNNIPILFDAKHDRHIQFNSTLCPNGIGGSNYSPTHTVCPEDVL